MINELISFRRSMETWGVVPKQNLHTNLKPVPKGGKHWEVRIGEGGSVISAAESVATNRLYYVKNKNNTTPVFKIDGNDSAKTIAGKVSRCIACAVSLQDMPEDPRSKALKQLTSWLKDCDIETLTAVLVNHPQGVVYVCFEVADPLQFENGVQSQPCYDAINEHLYKKSSVVTGEKDAFGNDAAGWESPLLPVQRIKLYSRYDQNPCFAKWGLNGRFCCRIGNQTREQCNSLLQYIFAPERQLTPTQAGIWYNYVTGGESKSKRREYRVLSTLSPRSNLMESPMIEGFDEQIWNREVQELLKMYKNSGANAVQIDGQVVVLCFLGNVPTVLEYTKSFTGEELCNCTQRWDDGLHNDDDYAFSYFPLLNIRTFYDILSYQWRQRADSMEKAKKDGKSIRSSLFSLSDVYDLYFDDADVLRRIAIHLSRLVPYCLVNLHSQEKQDYHLSRCVPFCFRLVLHKLGIYKERFMDHWAYRLGRMFSEANEIHRLYFRSRNFEPPATRIGQRFIRQAYERPQTATAFFLKAFDVYARWAEFPSDRASRCQLAARKRLSSMRAMQSHLGDVPVKCTPKDLLLMHLGYIHRKPKPATGAKPLVEQVNEQVVAIVADSHTGLATEKSEIPFD